MPYFIRGILFILLLGSTFPIFAQQKVLDPKKSISQYSLKVWTTDNGLPSISLTDLVQADNQYIWIATYNGLSRFDGIEFTNYTIENVSELKSNAITTLEYQAGILWIGSHKGLIYHQNAKFYEAEALKPLQSTSIEKVKYDKSGRLWIGTTSKGLYCFEDNKLRKLENPLLARSPINSIVEDHSGTIWIGTDKGEIFKHQGNDLRLVYTSDLTAGIAAMFLDKAGFVWVTADNGVFTISNGIISKNDALSVNSNFGDIIQDDFGNIWLTNNNGIIRYKQGILERYSEKQGLPNNLIRKLLFDHQGNLWIASYRSGLFQLTDGVFTTFSSTEGLSGNVVTSIVETDDDTYWIASEGGYIDILKNGYLSPLQIRTPSARLKHLMKDSKGNVWVSTYGGLLKLDKNGQKLPLPNALRNMDNYVRMTFEDQEGNLWIGTRRTGVYRLDWHGTLDHFDTKNGLASNFIMSIDQDAEGQVIVGSKNGLNIFKGNQMVDLINKEDSLPTNFVFDVLVDGQIWWIATDLGLCRYDKVLKTYTLFDNNNGLGESIVFDIVQDDMGYLWMSSNSGVIRAEKEQIKAYTQGQRNSITVKLFNKSDGMKSEQCVGATKMLVDSKNNIWIPTVMGATSIHPNTITQSNPNVLGMIESITADGKTFLPSDKISIEAGGAKRIHISFTAFDFITPSKVNFKYRLVPFDDHWQTTNGERTVDYTNLAPDNYTFEVKPELGKEIKANLSSINFKVEAYFYQTKLFYALCLLSFLAITYAIYKTRINQIKAREAELQRRVEERTKEVVLQKDKIEQQREEIEAAFEELKETQLQMVESEKMASLGQLTAGVAHELNNPINFVFAGINSLKIQINDLMELVGIYSKIDTEKNAEQIEAIQNEVKELKEELEFDDFEDDVIGLIQDVEDGAARTTEIVKSLRIFTRIDSGKELQLTDLHDVINSTLIILRNTYKDRIKIEKEFNNLPMISCNVGKISQVFTNIISNAVDAIDERGEITIMTSSFKANGNISELIEGKDYAEIKIKDSGKGISQENLNRIFDSFYTTKEVGKGTGLGLSISKDIIEKHHGKLMVESAIGQGSTFTIIIPIEQAAFEH